MKKEKKKCKFDYRHIIAIAITLGLMALAIFKFNTGYVRIWESLQDLFWSVGYYFAELFDVEHNIEVTVNNYSVVPWTPFLGLPSTWEEFVQKWETYWDIIFTKENFVQYMIFLSNLLLLIRNLETTFQQKQYDTFKANRKSAGRNILSGKLANHFIVTSAAAAGCA